MFKNIIEIFKTWFLKIGLGVGLLSVLIQYVWAKWIPTTTLNVTFSTLEFNVREAVTGGLTDFTSPLLNFLKMDLSLPGVIISILSAALIVFVGRLVYEFLPFGTQGKKVSKLWLVLFYGATLLSLVLIGFGIPAFNAIIIAAVHYLLIAAVYNYLTTNIKVFSKIKIP